MKFRRGKFFDSGSRSLNQNRGEQPVCRVLAVIALNSIAKNCEAGCGYAGAAKPWVSCASRLSLQMKKARRLGQAFFRIDL
jgi:hypothetical protein